MSEMVLIKNILLFLLILAAALDSVKAGFLTDYQQIDSNVLDHANVYLINKLDSDSALEFAIIVDSDYATIARMVSAIEDWFYKQNVTTQRTFYIWLEDTKRQSEIAKSIFESKTREFDPKVIQVFRKAMKNFYRTDVSQSEQSSVYRELYHDLDLDQQRQLDQLYYQTYERSSFHFVTPNVDFDKYQRIMIGQSEE